MADTKITALTALTAADPANDVLPIVDVSDTTMAASGTTKKISVNNILGAGGTATLASATITGNLTGQSNVYVPASTSFKIGPTASTWGGLRFDASSQPFLDSDGSIYFRTGGSTSFTTSYAIGATGISTWSVSGSTAMTLNSTGLGVGASPLYQLHVSKSQSSQTAIYVDNQQNNAAASSALTLSAYGGYWNLSVPQSATFVNPLIFKFGSTEMMRLDASGNVGIGVTPSAWAAFTAFQVSRGSVSGNVSELDVSHNAFYDGSWKYIANGFATNHYQTNGTYVWRTAPSGTAGNAITFTQAMTLDASGRLIINSSTFIPPTLNTNGDLNFIATSNTNVRFSYRGTDGVTRVANITLA